MKQKKINLFCSILFLSFIFLGFNTKITKAQTLPDKVLDPVQAVEVKDAFSNDFEEVSVEFIGDEKIVVLPVEIDGVGILKTTIFKSYDNYRSVNVEVYSNEDLTKKIQYGITLFSNKNDESLDGYYNVDKAGTVYVKYTISKGYNVKDDAEFITSHFFIPRNRTLKEHEIYIGYQESSTPKSTYKITAPSDGIISLALEPVDQDSHSTKLQLLNSKKEEISKASYMNKNKEGESESFYAVKKGTYYITLDTNCKMYVFAYDFEEVKDKSGSTMAKATTMKTGTNYKGALLATDKKSVTDWFKFSVSKKSERDIVISSKIDGKLDVIITDSKGKQILFGKVGLNTGEDTITIPGEFTKGTFYIKVVKRDANASGFYNIKIK